MTDDAKPQAVQPLTPFPTSEKDQADNLRDHGIYEVQPIQADVEALTELDALIAAAKNGSDYWPLLDILTRAAAAIRQSIQERHSS